MQVCPAVIVQAPPETVWGLLTSAEGYTSWIDGRVERVTPDGPASEGQLIEVTTPAAGRRWAVTIEVTSLDTERRRLGLRVALPLGIVNQELVTVDPAGDDRSLLRFN